MSLSDRLGDDQKAAMKSGDQTRKDVLRLLRSRIKEAAVAKREDLEDEEIYKLIMTEVKRRQEAIDLFEKGGREDLAGREKLEIEILEGYLPPKLSEDDLKVHAQEAIQEAGAADPRDMGKVMKILMPKVTGRAEGSQVSKIVKGLLAGRKD
jgi:uncharacterized protein YqeY